MAPAHPSAEQGAEYAGTASRGGVVHAAVVSAPIELAPLIAKAQHDGVGALSVFLGTVRNLNDGKPVSGMEYEAYPAMAERELAAVAADACAKQPGLTVAVEHRVGTLGIGEVSVAIVASHAHRAEACDGARAVIEALKVRVPIWKREHYLDGTREWIDPTRALPPKERH
jgi:molybdopterin synthase catalytic subunit